MIDLFNLFIFLIQQILQMEIFIYCFSIILIGSIFNLIRYRLF